MPLIYSKLLRDQLISDLKTQRYNLGHLADEVGVARNQISYWLHGKNRPSWRAAQRLSTAATKLTGKTYTPIMFLEIKP